MIRQAVIRQDGCLSLIFINKAVIDQIKHHGGKGPVTKSQFTIPYERTIEILKDKATIKSPVGIAPKSQITVSRSKGNEISEVFVREVDTGQIVIRLPTEYGGLPTTKLTILTDKYGNLVNVYPGPFNY